MAQAGPGTVWTELPPVPLQPGEAEKILAQFAVRVTRRKRSGRSGVRAAKAANLLDTK